MDELLQVIDGMEDVLVGKTQYWLVGAG